MDPDEEVLQRSQTCHGAPLAGISARRISGTLEHLERAGSVNSTRSANVATPTQLGRTSSRSNTGVLMRTNSGFQVGLMPPEQLRELQCGVCANLIQSAVHAPCGHSFCQCHLEADDSARNELEVQA